jgi:hypothetical protein
MKKIRGALGALGARGVFTMQEVAYNACYGGFELADEVYMELGVFAPSKIRRDDHRLIQLVKEKGMAASGEDANVKIAQIPDGCNWTILDRDGLEEVVIVQQISA